MSEHRFEKIKTVLVVLSSKAMSFDMPALRNFITQAYPGAAVFFMSTSGDSIGAQVPRQVDLVIDFTPMGARQPLFLARRLMRMARFSVGRNVGRFGYRKRNFTRVYDQLLDQASGSIPKDYLESEAWEQRKVLELAGVRLVKQGGVGEDLSKRSHPH